ncbi:MAG: C4-dicarboxylate ABC transporter substrate-binding protein, partial [Gammaproteobacteria bacterium]|nr:C4-dicarboxylate ABC transporter substrate-binding protein [Gammaproteobacteria bacterium]
MLKSAIRGSLAVAGIACAIAAVPALQAAETTLRFGTYVNKVDARYAGFQNFARLVSEKSNGRVEVQIFDSGTLHPFNKAFDSILGGVSDISPVTGEKRIPCHRMTSFTPVAIDWERHVDLDKEYTALVADELAKAGLINVLSSNFSYDQEWWFKTPDVQLDKLDGRLVRDIGPVMTHIIKKWGGKPVFIAPTEVYQGAERGVVDAINMGVATFSSWKLWDVMPHMINANLFYGNIMYMMNKRKFDSLSPADQQAILEAGEEAQRAIKEPYEKWINEKVGEAVMKSGGSARALPKAERLRLIESA